MYSSEFYDRLLANAAFLTAYAQKLTHDGEAAKDLYQETMLRALSNRDKFEEGTNLKAWTIIIMRNIFINAYRSKKAKEKAFDELHRQAQARFQRPNNRNDGETNLSARYIEKKIFVLPAIFKTPFMLYYEGYLYREIAHILEEPLGTVKSRIHFARRMLKTSFAES